GYQRVQRCQRDWLCIRQPGGLRHVTGYRESDSDGGAGDSNISQAGWRNSSPGDVHASAFRTCSVGNKHALSAIGESAGGGSVLGRRRRTGSAGLEIQSQQFIYCAAASDAALGPKFAELLKSWWAL